MKKYISFLFIIFFFLSLNSFSQELESLLEMDLEELMNLNIVSASNTSEKLSEAPATVIVITKDDINKRGYTELSQIFDDLPGMDITRPWGDTYVKNYWRGYRNSIGDPYLIMIDGIIYNHLYFNNTDILITLPLSNIDRIEVVYGPASSVYGPNAFMGVINIITLKDKAKNGTFVSAKLLTGSNETKFVDVSYFYKKDNVRVSLTGKFDYGLLDDSFINDYEYTKSSYMADTLLWSNFLIKKLNLGGKFKSPRRNMALDLRGYFGKTELGFQYYVKDTGYGMYYPSDKVQNDASWKIPEMSIYLRHNQEINENINSTTLLRYRTSNVSNESYYIEGYESGGKRYVDISYWQSLNRSISLFQDFDIHYSDKLSFNTGLKYEQKKLQKAYDVTYGASLQPENVDISILPEPPQAVDHVGNFVYTEDYGLYFQGKYKLSNLLLENDYHNIVLGVRYDKNSKYGEAKMLRSGYVMNYKGWGLKLLFGQAFQEPTPRMLFGGWAGAGSNPDLKPEKSKTFESSLSYTTKYISNLLSIYLVKNEETIVTAGKTAKNLGDRDVIGLDYHVQGIIPVKFIKQLKIWGYYSQLLKEEEKKIKMSSNGTVISDSIGSIGDLANMKMHFGLTGIITNNISTTILARYIGKKETFVTNPIDEVDGYFTLDLNFLYENLFAKGLGLSFKVDNLFNTKYFHPGGRDANAGNTPGNWDNGVYTGSKGWYNSLLPQPGRTINIALIFNY